MNTLEQSKIEFATETNILEMLGEVIGELDQSLATLAAISAQAEALSPDMASPHKYYVDKENSFSVSLQVNTLIGVIQQLRSEYKKVASWEETPGISPLKEDFRILVESDKHP